MKKVFTILSVGILKIILFIAILIEKFFELFKNFAIFIAATVIYLFLKARGDLKNKTMSDMIKDWMRYHSDIFYVDETEKSYT